MPLILLCLYSVPTEGHAGAVRGGPRLSAVSRLPRQVQHQEDEEVSGSIYLQQNRFKNQDLGSFHKHQKKESPLA